MIYINNSTEFIEIPRFSAKLGDRLVLINQITKVELSVNFEDDGLGSYYRIPVGDIIERFETGQYDYYLYGGDFDLGKGILQFDDFTKKVVEYNDDIEVIQYTPDMEYTPVPDRVIKIEKNGVYDVKSYDKADVDVKPELTKLPNGVRFENSRWTECPSFDYINLTDAFHLFYDNSNLVKIGEMLNTGNITSMAGMFEGCTNLKSVPKMDTNTSNVRSMSTMFYYCKNITSIPLFNTSNVRNMEQMFVYCSSITTVPAFDTSKVTNMSYMFDRCGSLKSIPAFNTSKVTDMSYMFRSCHSLTTIPILDMSSVYDITNMFFWADILTDLGGFVNLGKAFKYDETFNLSSTSRLTNQSVQNLIDTIYDMNLNTQGGSATLRLSQSVINSMSDTQKSQLAAKGWTLTN